MSTQQPSSLPLAGYAGEDWTADPAQMTYARGARNGPNNGSAGMFSGGTILGLTVLAALVGAAYVAYSVAPDVIRYMKIRNM